ncbi:MAG: HAD hydrolase family protein [Myxococcaceae bacterium]|nr:HAD hydrolase family protein [Myxococcaceae bacterium]
MVFDVDGVMTDGGLWYGPEGEVFKRFDVKDGHALVLARLTGLPAAILTARTSKIVAVRGAELKLAKVMQGKKDKGPALHELCAELGVTPADCSYMGDDVNDLAPMRLVGLAACPQDAAPETRAGSHFVARSPGGHGAVRELCELVMKATGRWEKALELLGAGALTQL